jgi:hypothetical protein
MNAYIFPRVLGYVNGAIFGLIALVIALAGRFGVSFMICAGTGTLFASCGWLVGKGTLWPLIFPWIPAMIAFLWSTKGESFGLFDGGLVLFPILFYLVGGIIGSIIMYFDGRVSAKER